MRRKRLDDHGTIHYLAGYERNVGNGLSTADVVTKYYGVTLGKLSRLIAIRKNGTLYWVGTDHLGSTVRVADASFNAVDQMRYLPYGGSRDAGGSLQTDHKFTGQIEDQSIGLYWYNSRAYDAGLGRFVAADTVVPRPGNPQTLNRYAYTLNNPLRYTDPSGHLNDPFGGGGGGGSSTTQWLSGSSDDWPYVDPVEDPPASPPPTSTPVPPGGGDPPQAPPASGSETPVPVPAPSPAPSGTATPVTCPVPVGPTGTLDYGFLVNRGNDLAWEVGPDAFASQTREVWRYGPAEGWRTGAKQVIYLSPDLAKWRFTEPAYPMIAKLAGSGIAKAATGAVGSGVIQGVSDLFNSGLTPEQRAGRVGLAVGGSLVAAGVGALVVTAGLPVVVAVGVGLVVGAYIDVRLNNGGFAELGLG